MGAIALAAQVIPPIPTHFSVAWSVCLSVVCRRSHSHSCKSKSKVRLYYSAL